MLLFAQVGGDVAELAWLGGTWAEHKPDGSWTEEYWTPPREGLMLGAGLAGRGSTVRHFEHMRIFTGVDGKIAFVGMPNGGDGVRFPMVRMSTSEVVFENPAHDYPQRIHYRLVGQTIVATVSRIDGSREQRWVFVRP